MTAPAVHAATYTVTTTADAGAGSLRQAILDSNGSIGIADTIDFNLAGAGPHVIQPVTALPQVTDHVTIDGSAELSSGWPLVTIDGGPVSAPSLYGLDVQSVAFGATQIRALAFTRWDTGNGAGLRLAGTGTSTVFGNLFGLDAAGTPLGNYAGITVEGSMGSNIGGTAAGTRNVVSGNTTGISLASSTATSSVIGNWIGVGLDGTSVLGNSLQGVLAQAGNHQVGFTTAPSANRIRHNGTGVRVTSGSTSVRGNEIDLNAALGIDLGLDGVTANDAGDADSGPNNLQNYPTGLSASLAGGQIQISGTLDSIGDTTYALHFYSSEAADPSGHGEGANFLGSVTTGNGSFSYTFTPIVPVAAGEFITATATDPGVLPGGPNTSEFSAAVVATEPSTDVATVGIDADPPCLNPLLAACTFGPGQWITATALAGAFRVLPNSSFEPVIVEGVDVETAPFRLTYHIKEQAVWSDATPLTSADFAFTLDTIRNPDNSIASRAGYALVTQVDQIDDKTFRLTFSAPYPDWRSLFPVVLPEHILSGHDFDQVLLDEIADPVTHEPIGSGPFLLTERSPGESLTVSRNPRWWGATVPALQSIVFEVVPSANDQFDGVGSGALDLIFPQPQARIADMEELAGIAVQSAPGTAMEHLDFHVQSADMPLLQQRWFRQAVAYSIDRDALATAAYGSLIPGYPALHNLTFASSQTAYRPVFSRYAYNPEAVSALMLENECVRGPDDIWSCSGTRASVKLATTTGNQIRELVQQAMIAQAKAAGIELVPDNSSSGVLFGERLPARDYESILFTWVLGGLDPRDQYACAGTANDLGYCSDGVDSLLEDAATEVDPALRAQLLNDANRVLAVDVPTIPLFRRPAFLVQRETLQGPRLNPAGQATWNVEAWNLGTTFVVNSAADPGDGTCDATCTLRDAVDDANAAAGDDRIEFAIGSGAQTISLASGLPFVTDPVVIDATTQPGYAGTPLIQLDGADAGPSTPGFEITAGGSTVRGFSITNFSWDGVKMHDGDGNTVEDNYLGVFQDGGELGGAGNGTYGVLADFGSSANVIRRNVIGANGFGAGGPYSGIGIWHEAADNVVEGNNVGLAPTGAALPNAIGVIVADTTGAHLSANTIAHNAGTGVVVFGAASGNRIVGNSIFANGGLGIDLGFDGVTPNDEGDTDSGANAKQNFPVITDVSSAGGITTVTGTIEGVPGPFFDFDLYAERRLRRLRQRRRGGTPRRRRGRRRRDRLLDLVPGSQRVGRLDPDGDGDRVRQHLGVRALRRRGGQRHVDRHHGRRQQRRRLHADELLAARGDRRCERARRKADDRLRDPARRRPDDRSRRRPAPDHRSGDHRRDHADGPAARSHRRRRRPEHDELHPRCPAPRRGLWRLDAPRVRRQQRRHERHPDLVGRQHRREQPDRHQRSRHRGGSERDRHSGRGVVEHDRRAHGRGPERHLRQRVLRADAERVGEHRRRQLRRSLG